MSVTEVPATAHRVGRCMDGEACPVCRHYLRPVPPTSLIYYLRRYPSHDVKIGTTTRLPRRMSELGMCGLVPDRTDAVVLLAVHLGTPLHERLLHEQFVDCRIGRTEWFRSTPALEAWLQRVTAPESWALGAGR